MKIALYGLHRGSSVDPDTLARRAHLAEEEGIDELWVGDHIALPTTEDEVMLQQPRLEAVVALSHLAALTTRVGLGFGVIVLPQRQPVLLAKQLASIDALSKGRLIVGLGVGYVEAELAAMGVSLADRAAKTDEYLAAMRTLWDEPAASFSGRFVSFDDVVQRPRPTQRPHPPIIVGGHSGAAYRRAVRSANGWFGWDLDVEQTAQCLKKLRANGIDEREKFEISITPPDNPPNLETVRRYADLGVDRLVIQPHTMDGTVIEELITTIGKTIIGRV